MCNNIGYGLVKDGLFNTYLYWCLCFRWFIPFNKRNVKMKCPICKKEYEPVLERKTDELVQIEFPEASRTEREQLITGICSDECWEEIFKDV